MRAQLIVVWFLHGFVVDGESLEGEVTVMNEPTITAHFTPRKDVGVVGDNIEKKIANLQNKASEASAPPKLGAFLTEVQSNSIAASPAASPRRNDQRMKGFEKRASLVKAEPVKQVFPFTRDGVTALPETLRASQLLDDAGADLDDSVPLRVQSDLADICVSAASCRFLAAAFWWFAMESIEDTSFKTQHHDWVFGQMADNYAALCIQLPRRLRSYVFQYTVQCQ